MGSTSSKKNILSAATVALGVFTLVASLDLTGWFEVVELKALDHLVRRYADPAKADLDLLLLAVDESSRRNFSTACVRFSEAVNLDPSDGPSRVYLDGSIIYRQDPPPSAWDGVYELTSK